MLLPRSWRHETARKEAEMLVLRGQPIHDSLRLYVPEGLEPGWIKEAPEDFRVFERHDGFLCTTSLESDMAASVETGSRRETGFVGVTLAKRLMKTPDAVAALAERF